MQSQTHMYHSIKLSESHIIAILLNSLDQAEKNSLLINYYFFFIPAITKHYVYVIKCVNEDTPNQHNPKKQLPCALIQLLARFSIKDKPVHFLHFRFRRFFS